MLTETLESVKESASKVKNGAQAAIITQLTLRGIVRNMGKQWKKLMKKAAKNSALSKLFAAISFMQLVVYHPLIKDV